MNHADRKAESLRLTKQLGRQVYFRRVRCSCSFDPFCERCAGDDEYYVESFKFCGHAVEGSESDCADGDCERLEKEEQERAVA